MNIEVNLTGVDEDIDELVNYLNANELYLANAVLARGMEDFIRRWYTEKGRDIFVNPSLSTHGPGRIESRWCEGIPARWYGDPTDEGASFVFDDNGYGLAIKLNGGVISASRAKALTIPLVPEAHGVRARDYRSNLFTVKRKDGKQLGYLFEQTQGGGIRAVYALRKSVTIKANPNVIPSSHELLDAAIDYFTDGLTKPM